MKQLHGQNNGHADNSTANLDLNQNPNPNPDLNPDLNPPPKTAIKLALGHHPVNLCTLPQQALQKMFRPGKKYRKSPGYRKITQRYVLTSPSKGLEFATEKNATTQNVRRC